MYRKQKVTNHETMDLGIGIWIHTLYGVYRARSRTT